MRRLAALLAALAVPWVAALADSPARLDSDAAQQQAARASFESFATDWMARAQARSQHERANPRLAQGAKDLVATYREVAPGFETEVKPTGRAGTPWVGVLRYEERVVTCADLHGTDCHVVSTVPVTEVFRLRDGHWVY